MSKTTTNIRTRRGIVIPLFALLLPVLLMLCAFAINLAYVQLTATELKVATDAAARAGGRAWSETQQISDAKNYAQTAASLNTVAGQALSIRTEDNANEIEFGLSQRGSNGFGRYTFTKKNTTDVENGSEEATSIRINGRRDSGSLGGPVQLLLGGVGSTSLFDPVVSSICTQVDRDISLILDRSGSMAFHVDWDGDAYGQSWNDLLNWAANQMNYYANNGGEWRYSYYYGWYWVWLDAGMQQAYYDMYDYYWDLDDYYDNGWGPHWSDDVPSPSRWESLVAGVNAFLDVLETTDQEEHVSLGSFASSGSLEYSLQTNYNNIRNWVDDEQPWGGTAIHDGLAQAYMSLYGSAGRPYAAKTIVVLTDGQNNAGGQVVINQVNSIVASHNITVHTVTFTAGADQTTMQSVAAAGGGKHFHADDTAGLVAIFEEIANNLPTIITE